MVKNMSFWRGKRVLITGHTGFKGSWLALWLSLKGADVLGYALDPPTEPNLFESARVIERVQSKKGDICNLDSLQGTFESFQPDVVFHLAAQPLVRYSYQFPVETYKANVMGTVNVLEAVRSTRSAKACIIVTSDKCYENKEWMWGYREIDPMGGFDPYSSSKGCAELITSAYRRSYFSQVEGNGANVAISTVRAGNVIGGGDWAADRLIPDVMKAFLSGESVLIRYPQAVRPWQHVLEPLHGYMMLAERMWKDCSTYSGGWNFGPHESDAKSVGWVVQEIAQMFGPTAEWHIPEEEHPHEAKYLKLDCAKASDLLGWSPITNLKTALEWTVNWYMLSSKNLDMQRYTENQILEYENLITKKEKGIIL